MKGFLKAIKKGVGMKTRDVKNPKFKGYSGAAKKGLKVGSAGLGFAAMAAVGAADKIKKASKAANKEIMGQHSKARNKAHDDQIKLMHKRALAKNKKK